MEEHYLTPSGSSFVYSRFRKKNIHKNLFISNKKIHTDLLWDYYSSILCLDEAKLSLKQPQPIILNGIETLHLQYCYVFLSSFCPSFTLPSDICMNAQMLLWDFNLTCLLHFFFSASLSAMWTISLGLCIRVFYCLRSMHRKPSAWMRLFNQIRLLLSGLVSQTDSGFCSI